MKINESLRAQDLRHMIKKVFGIDSYKSKVGNDEEVVVLSFVVSEEDPAKDLEKNVRGLMTQGFQKLDLVTREEFDLQTQVLAKTRAKLEELEAKVSALEKK